VAEPRRLVVFDWDGTLMDSTGQIVAAAMATISDLGLPERSPDAVRDIIGLGLREGWHRLFPELDAAGFAAFVDAYRERFLSPAFQTARLFERAAEVVEELAGRGLVLAVATGKSRRGLDRDLDATGLGRFMAASRTAEETRSKPAPAMLLELMQRIGAAPDTTVMVGDTEWDLEMARRAGVPAVAAGYGAHAPERLQRYAPLACIDSIAALPTLLT
jgi:phosphoglycolate phosphatase